MGKQITYKQQSKQSGLRAPGKQSRPITRRNSDSREWQGKHRKNKNQKHGGDAPKKAVHIKIDKGAPFQIEEVTEPADSKIGKTCGILFDKLNRLLRADFVTRLIVENRKQIERGAKCKSAGRLWVITDIQVIPHRGLNAGQPVRKQ